jgi:glycosyltransferase involved in cell wall biosynthesis
VTLNARVADFYALDRFVERIQLDLSGPSSNLVAACRANLRRIRALRRLFVELRPDVIVSFTSAVTVNCVIAATNLKTSVIALETTDPTNQQRRPRLVRRLVDRLAYARACRVVVLAGAIRESLARWWPRLRLVQIPTPVPEELLRMQMPGPVAGRPRIVTLSRLNAEKGLDLLVTAFARLARRFPEWDLWIWSEGPERGHLESLVDEFELNGRVFLPGRTDSPWEELARATIFVLPSRREGFPGALVEAMALGRPAVAFDCRSGPREISRGGRDAILVRPGDIDSLTDAIATLIADPAKREDLGRCAVAVRERYHPALVAQQWESLLQEVVANQSHPTETRTGGLAVVSDEAPILLRHGQ